jgi:outer membrane protein assembly factor BamB
MNASKSSTPLMIAIFLFSISCSCKSLLSSDGEQVLWQTQIGFGSLIFADSPVQELSNGILFAGIREPNNVLYLIDKGDGSIKWEWSDWILPRESVLLEGFYLFQNTLLFQNGSKTYAVDIQTGKTLWRIQHKSDARLVTGIGDTFFFTPQAINIAQGSIQNAAYRELFSIEEPTGYRTSIKTPVPFLAQNGDTLLLTTRGGIQLMNSFSAPTYLMLYNLTKRQLLYDSVQKTNSVGGLPQIVGTKVYMDIGRSLQCNDIYTGKLLWKKDFESSFIVSGLTVSDGKVFAGCEDTNFYCLDAETGNTLWQLNGVAGGSHKPFVMNGVVYFTRTYLYAVDIQNGQVLWKRECPEQAQNGSVYFFGRVTGSNGRIYCQSYKSAYCYKAAR